ncbi:MAG: transporter substrate-binding domain-containing protein [Lachnospiraceae bacterium]|nr:transporter substrate-binding domain-containing protein [Lachnospiraceae bacterium]MDO4734057.1 transporter substrate-binding domain-containing protein [Lachnospiraceae bacterium]
MKKKIISIIISGLLAVTVVLSLAACGGNSGGGAAPAGSGADNAEKTTFIMGIDPEYPPFSYLGDDGKYTGFDVEICQAACDKLGMELEIFEVNWDNKLIQLDAKECDCIWSGMTILDSMKEAGYVLSDPYFDNTQVLLVKADGGINSSADLAGKDVAVQLGTSGDQLLSSDLEELAATFNSVVRCDSFLKCFTELDGNAVEAVLVDEPVAKAYISEHEGFVILDEDLGGEQYGICFRSDDQALCDQIQGAIAELVADGTYKQIAESNKDYADLIPNLIFLQ